MRTLTPEKLLKSKILKYVFSNPSKTFRVMETARALKVSPAHVSNSLAYFSSLGLIRKGRLILESPLVRSAKLFHNISKLESIKCVKNARKSMPALMGIGVYGSWAKGENLEDSDLDLWILCPKPPDEKRVASLQAYLSKKLATEPNILALWPEKIESLKKTSPTFYWSLVFSSFVLRGEGVE